MNMNGVGIAGSANRVNGVNGGRTPPTELDNKVEGKKSPETPDVKPEQTTAVVGGGWLESAAAKITDTCLPASQMGRAALKGAVVGGAVFLGVAVGAAELLKHYGHVPGQHDQVADALAEIFGSAFSGVLGATLGGVLAAGRARNPDGPSAQGGVQHV